MPESASRGNLDGEDPQSAESPGEVQNRGHEEQPDPVASREPREEREDERIADREEQEQPDRAEVLRQLEHGGQ